MRARPGRSRRCPLLLATLVLLLAIGHACVLAVVAEAAAPHESSTGHEHGSAGELACEPLEALPTAAPGSDRSPASVILPGPAAPAAADRVLVSAHRTESPPGPPGRPRLFLLLAVLLI
jgi:hypothetical protein